MVREAVNPYGDQRYVSGAVRPIVATRTKVPKCQKPRAGWFCWFAKRGGRRLLLHYDRLTNMYALISHVGHKAATRPRLSLLVGASNAFLPATDHMLAFLILLRRATRGR